MHRLRLKFARGEKLKFLSHLDLMRLWERALRRAGLPPAYSEGFSPHPRISLAAPLAVGITSQAELMDVFLDRRISPGLFSQKVSSQLPEGIEILEVTAARLDEPSLQSRVRFAEYAVEVETDRVAPEIEADLGKLLAAEQWPWHHARDTGERFYDLRTLVDDLWLINNRDRTCIIGMRLRCDPSGSGRPEQVAKALGLTDLPKSIQRTKLILT